MNVRGKTALITGGAGGLGKALAECFLKQGAKVVLWDINAGALAAAHQELSALGNIRAYPVDITDRHEVSAVAQMIKREVGFIDILNNNAGIVYGGDFLSLSEEQIIRTVEVNFLAALWCTKTFLPEMMEKNSGHIVMTASAAGLLGVPGMSVYAASKHALIGFAESLRLELKRRGKQKIGITIACPSFIKTGLFDGVRPPTLTPWLNPGDLAEKIFQAVLKNRLYVREPFMVKLIPTIKGLGGIETTDRLGDLLGLHSAMDTWKGRPKHNI
ncbi:MAG: SDR family oxidoreductase [Elusimicrobia bacterium]|nr:SDR family oxidoreductase [Elusimicrobiota bacterium]